MGVRSDSARTRPEARRSEVTAAYEARYELARSGGARCGPTCLAEKSRDEPRGSRVFRRRSQDRTRESQRALGIAREAQRMRTTQW